MNTIKFAPYNSFVTEQHNVERGYMRRLELNGEKLKVYQPCNLDVVVINACQNHCFFCINRNYTGDIICNDFVRGLEEVLTRLKQTELDFEATITGGEPTIRPDRFVKTIKSLHKFGIRERTVSTTGWNLLETYDGKPLIQHLIDCGYTHNISISRMATDRADNDKLMGIKGKLRNIDDDELLRIARYCNTYGVELRTSTNLISSYNGVDGISDLDGILKFVSHQASNRIYSCLFRELVGNFREKVDIKPIQDQIHNDPRFEYVKDIDGLFYHIKMYIYTDMDGRQYAVKCYQDEVAANCSYGRLSYKSGILRAGFDGPILYDYKKEHPTNE